MHSSTLKLIASKKDTISLSPQQQLSLSLITKKIINTYCSCYLYCYLVSQSISQLPKLLFTSFSICSQSCKLLAFLVSNCYIKSLTYNITLLYSESSLCFKPIMLFDQSYQLLLPLKIHYKYIVIQFELTLLNFKIIFR